MTLKFSPPPLAEKAIPTLGYYSERTGLRTFGRRCDVTNSINYQLIGNEATPETKDLLYRDRKYHTIYRYDTYVLESVDGVWYTQFFVPKGTLYNQDYRNHQVVRVSSNYVSSSYNSDYTHDYPLSKLEYYQEKVLETMNATQGYKYNSATVVWVKKSKAVVLEEYVNWRISVGKEVWQGELTTQAQPATV